MRGKKTAAIAFAVLSASAIVTGSVYAAMNYSADDLNNLSNYILEADDVTTADDVNGDGVIDSFDLCEMRASFNGTGEFAEQSYLAVDQYVKLVGRTLHSNEVTWLVQSGAAVEFTVTGKSAEITLAGDNSINNDADYRSRYAILVDDEIITDAVMSTEELVVPLFEGETSRTAKVKVIHLSEANNGAIGVKNISVVSDVAVPVRPTAKKDLSIEFIGDSITCAYGVEGASAYESFKTTTENFMKSYAYLTAQQLDAEYSAVSYSGYGIISGYTSGDKNTDSLVPDYYHLVGKSEDYAVDWDFSSALHDVVVINLGTNDSSYLSVDFENRSPEFVEGYVDFLELVRSKNPEAYIICTIGTMGCEDVYPLIEQAVTEYKGNSSDERVMCYQSATQNQADGIGSDWHPSAVTQQNSAYVLADKICQALGMESSQIGLDVAAEAEYEAVIDSEAGANASSYVGYDKSFWINMSTGGDSPEAVEAKVSGISLRENGTYRLEFDYTSTVDNTIPVLVRSSDGATIYHSATVDSVSDKNHYSAEFTMPQADENAEIVFQIGGLDYYNVTFSNIKLVKIA